MLRVPPFTTKIDFVSLDVAEGAALEITVVLDVALLFPMLSVLPEATLKHTSPVRVIV